MAREVREREADILKTILEGLSALRVWHTRCNSGAMFAEHGGKKRMLRFGRRGMADILAIRLQCDQCDTPYDGPHGHNRVYWLEVKRPGEKQTADQLMFQTEVIAEGHGYAVVHSWEEALEALK